MWGKKKHNDETKHMKFALHFHKADFTLQGVKY